MLLALLTGALFTRALAQAPATADEPEDAFAYEITVWGEPLVRQARWDLVVALKRMGWEPKQRSGGNTVFKPPRPWLGRADLTADGELSFRYPLVRFKRPGLANTMPDDPTESNPNLIRDPGGHVGTSGGFTLPAAEARMWLLPSKRILDGWYRRTREAVEPEIRTLRIARRDTEVKEQLDTLVQGLDGLWEHGTPLVGTQPIPKERRLNAVLLHWATRAETFEGAQSTAAIETWLRNTVEVTEADCDTIQSLRDDARPCPVVDSEPVEPVEPAAGSLTP